MAGSAFDVDPLLVLKIEGISVLVLFLLGKAFGNPGLGLGWAFETGYGD